MGRQGPKPGRVSVNKGLVVDAKVVEPPPSGTDSSGDAPARPAGVASRGSAGRGTRVVARLCSPASILFLAVVAFIGVISAVSWLRYLELTTSAWDLGIYQQALWSAGHGARFFEAPDFETGGFGSFLQVHSAFILYAVAPLYGAWPSPATLFVVQAAVVSAAALPLFALVRCLGGSGRRSLAIAGMYLTSTLAISSSLYDFHIEAFIPVETFTLILFWAQRRYLLGAGVATVGFLTMEAVPILTFSVAVFFLIGEVHQVWTGPEGGSRPGPFHRVITLTRRPPVLPTVGLAVASVVAYYLLLGARMHYLSEFAGFPAFPQGNFGYVIGGTPQALGLSVTALGTGFYAKVSYWLVAFALVAFSPLRVPRSLVLTAPWMAFTFLSADLNLVIIGFQYGFIVVAGLFPAVAYSLATWTPPRRVTEMAQPARTGRFRGGAWGRAVPVVLLTVLVALNIALTPLDPLTQGYGSGSGYQVSYTTAPGFSDASRVAGLVPAGAAVVASDLLFPLVADDLRAYSLFWGANPYLVLPFNATNPPAYVLLAQSRLDAVPGWLTLQLYDPQVYGLRALAWSTPVGAVMLFERGFEGPALELGPSPPASRTISPADSGVGSNSWIVGEAGTPFGVALESVPFASGQLWATTGFGLEPGTYTFTFWVKAWASDPSRPPSPGMTVLELEGNPFAQGGWFSSGFSYAEVSAASFHPIVLTMNVSAPVVDVVLRGYASTWMAGVGLSEITIVRG